MFLLQYNVVINAWAKSAGKGAAAEAEKLLAKMHQLHEEGDPDVKPNVVTYGAVIDSYAKSGEKGAAARADTLLANMIQLHQMDPVKNSDLRPNTYVFNTGTFALFLLFTDIRRIYLFCFGGFQFVLSGRV